MTNNEATKMLRTIKRTVCLGNRKFHDALDVAIEALKAQNAVVHMDMPKISEDDLKKMLTKMNHQQQLEWIVDGTIPNNFGKDANVHSNDTISRQDVIELVKNSYYDLAESIEDTWAMVEDAEKLPSVHPKPRTGEWIYKDDLKQYFCNKCGYPSLTYDDVYIYGMDLPNFCEECGADMKGEHDGQTT